MSTANTQLRAYIVIDTTVLAKGSPELDNLKAAIRGVAAETEGAGDVNFRLAQASKEATISGRSLLFNFRMLSFAVRTLRRELGVTNPAFEQLSRFMLIGAAAGSLLVSSHQLITRGLPALIGEAGRGMSIMAGFSKAFTAGSVAVIGLTVAVGALIGLAVGTWIGETFSPIKEITREISLYTDQVEELTQALSVLKVEQSDLTAESAMYAAAVARINYEISLQGEATAAQTETLKMLENASKRAAMEQAGLRAATAMTTAEATRAGAEKKQLEDEAKAYRERVWSFTGRRTPPEGIQRFNPFNQANREMIASAVGRTGPIEFLIDFTNARFGDARDITGAVRQGIDQGIRNLEQMRRGG